jgi:hypothetical protein
MEKLVFAFSVESSIVVSELFEGDLFFTVIISIEVGIEDIVVVLEYSPDDRIEVFVLFVLLKSREFWTEEFASEVDVSPKVVASVGVGFESVVVIFESTADDNVVVSELSEGGVTLPTTGSDVVWIEEDIFVVEVPLKVVVSIEVGTEDIVVVFEISLDDRIDISVLFVVPLISRKVWIKEFASEVEVSLKVVASVGAADDNVVVSKLSVDVVTLPKSGSDALEEEFIGVNNVPLRIVGSAEVGREVVFENSVDNIRVSLKVVASVGVVSVNVVVIFEITTDGNVFASKLFVSVRAGSESVLVIFESTIDGNVVVSELLLGVVILPTFAPDEVRFERVTVVFERCIGVDALSKLFVKVSLLRVLTTAGVEENSGSRVVFGNVIVVTLTRAKTLYNTNVSRRIDFMVVGTLAIKWAKINKVNIYTYLLRVKTNKL